MESNKPVHPLLAAIDALSYSGVEAALTTEPSGVTVVDDRGRTALSLAAAKGDAKIVTLLLEKEAADCVAGTHWSAAQYAAFKGHASVLAALVAKRGTAMANPAGVAMTPLLLACSRGHSECVKLLLDACPEAMSALAHGRTALMLAATSGSAETVTLLHGRGADLNATSPDGKTALMWAVVSHKPVTVECLAKLGADPDVRAPIPESAAVVPGQDRDKGTSAEDFANGKHNKDPTLRHIAIYLRMWREQRVATPGCSPPDMDPLPWVAHAEVTKTKEAVEAAAKPVEATQDGQDAIASGDATASVDESDIFGQDTVKDAAKSPGLQILDVTGEQEQAATKPAVNADADLDALD